MAEDTKRRFSWFTVFLWALVIALVLVRGPGATLDDLLAAAGSLVAWLPPRDRITEESRTPECRADLEGALETFSADFGLDYYVDDDDAQTLIDEGRLAKEYAGLGVLYVAHFGLDQQSDGCHLKFYKRTSRQPGQSGSTLGNYGTVPLERCVCS